MRKIHKDRLLKLAVFLEKLPRQKFDFSLIKGVNCKTTACAIGWCPTVFKKDWAVCSGPYEDRGKVKVFAVRLKSNKNHSNVEDSFGDAEKYFGLSEEEGNHLFQPNDQDTEQFGGCDLGEAATPKQVAKNIREFLELKD